MPSSNRRTKNNVPSQRQLRVGEEIKKVVSSCLYKVAQHNAILQQSIISVSMVRVTPDLKDATIFYTFFSGKEPSITGELNTMAPQIRQVIAKEMRLKYIPNIVFVYDKQIDKASKIEKLIQSLDDGGIKTE